VLSLLPRLPNYFTTSCSCFLSCLLCIAKIFVKNLEVKWQAWPNCLILLCRSCKSSWTQKKEHPDGRYRDGWLNEEASSCQLIRKHAGSPLPERILERVVSRSLHGWIHSIPSCTAISSMTTFCFGLGFFPLQWASSTGLLD